MNNKFVCFVLFVALAFIVVGCDGKDSTVNPKTEIPGLSYLGATGGTCNNNALSKVRSSQDNAVAVYSSKDSIRVVADVNYNCGTPFETSCAIKDRKVQMYIKDVCPDTSSCYQRCKCDYTFEFQFAQKGKDAYDYSVEMKSPLPNQSKILSEGTLEAK